ncbi:MAG TPA: hypothetical protein VJM31_18930 [Vicinamibacterales bacterium]|nr:hypothetical protein [Vicinamibacterales bacterium]
MKRQLQIFRARDAREVDQEMMPPAGVTTTVAEGLKAAAEAGLGDGSVIRHLFGDPATGMSLVYAWLKSNFILPIHSHDADCAYYVIGGEAHLGSEVLMAGDGFFVPRGTRYSYRAGANGVEVLEFRNATHFNIDFTGSGAALLGRIAETARNQAASWSSESPPEAVRRFTRNDQENWIETPTPGAH